MQFRISAATYRMEVEPNSTDLVISESKLSGEEVRQETERRGGEVEERWRANGGWMKGKSTDEVNSAKQKFKEMFDEVIEPAAGRRRS